MQALDDLGSGDLVKIRRAIYVLSGLLILFSNAMLSSSEIDFFGLKFRVDQEELKATFLLLLLLSVFIFLLKVSETIPAAISKILKYRDDAWWIPTEKEIAAYHKGEHEPNFYADHYYESGLDWDHEALNEKERREERRNRIEAHKDIISSFNSFFGKVLAPLATAGLAIFFPDSILILLKT